MKYGLWTLLGGLIIALIIIATDPLKPAGMEYFTRCITKSGAILYGTETHEYTPQQLELFGEFARNINFVECRDLETEKQIGICKEKEIPLYPMWELQDGSKYGGIKTIEQLAELTGCAIPEEPTS